MYCNVFFITRFGEVEVSCEGYNNRDDPYVLKGSCGLRYTLDYTKEGMNQQHQHNYYGDSSGYQGYSNSYSTKSHQKLSSQNWIADMIILCAVCLMCYTLYKTCIGFRYTGEDARSNTNDDYPHGGGGGGGYGWFGRGANHRPSQPGFRPEYTDNASCGNNIRQGATGTGAGGGGFWTGAMTGGLLGYMFSNAGRRNYGGQGQWGGGGWGTGRRGWGTGGGGGGSTGTRTASGFGGTSRR